MQDSEAAHANQQIIPTKSSRAFWLCLLGYAACLFLLLQAIPLWLDELIDLSQVVSHDVRGLLAYIPRNPGGVPVGYLTLAAMTNMFGTSPFFVRLPSACAAMGSAAGVYMIARAIPLRWPLLAAVLFALIPLQVRYALEARPYSIALCFSIWLTVIFFSLLRSFSWLKLVAYTVCLAAALYTQPFASFVVFAHLVGAFSSDANRRQVPAFVLSICIGFATFSPWYMYAHAVWTTEAAAQHPHSQIDARSLLLILRELTGAGYLGTAILLIAAAYALCKACPLKPNRLFWILAAALPVVLAVLADAYFHYFLAIRQMVFVLPILAILAAHGIGCLYEVHRQGSMLLGLVVTVVLLVADVRFFTRPHENWKAAATLMQRAKSESSCMLFIPEESIALYRVVDPKLNDAPCRPESVMRGDHTVMVAISPYAPLELYRQVEKRLRAMKLRKVKEENVVGPRVETFRSAP